MQVYKYNFNSGPSPLYPAVIAKLRDAVNNWDNSGISILEYGHRTEKVERMIAETLELTRELLDLDDDFESLILAGGATLQCCQIPMNFLRPDTVGAYLDSGVWSQVAIKEAVHFGKVEIVASGKDNNYQNIPKEIPILKNASYLHITLNNTAFGTEWDKIPQIESVPLVLDMTSNIFSRAYNHRHASLIYAGIQKNLGPAGATLLAIRKDFLAKQNPGLAPMFSYQNLIQHKSMFNTPPVFPIYACLLTLQHIKSIGGVKVIEAENFRKSSLLYETLDKYPDLYKTTVLKTDRSRMNVCFSLPSLEKEQELLKFADNQGVYGIKGHKLVGGFRVAIYNPIPFEHVEFLCDLLEKFAKRQ